MSFNPYIFFAGTCREAFTRYGEIFGGEVTLLTSADFPEEERMPGASDDMIMHAALKVGDALLMGSDDPTGSDGPKVGVGVAYTAPTAGEAQRTFAALAEGGEVQMPFSATSWSKGFGSCLDSFGVPWMVDTAEDA